MGYLTRFKLYLDPATPELIEFLELADIKDLKLCKCKHCERCRTIEKKAKEQPQVCGYGNEFLNWIWKGDAEPAKWCSYLEDMVNLSRMFPDVLFTLHAEGDDRENIWRVYFKDGKTQETKAKIQFEPFDEEKFNEEYKVDGSNS